MFTMCASSELHFGALREVVTRERQGALSCRGKSGRAQQRSTVSGDYALLDSARAESSSIVDKPGEC